jgi:DNA replicative helicase MCM subunit Mcm2 (Cdc46/Mcm family)
MSTSGDVELTERFIQFYQNYCSKAIEQLAERYPRKQRSLYIEYDDLYTFDSDLAEDYIAKPEILQRYAEEALRLFDTPGDVSLGQAHVRLTNLPDSPLKPGTVRIHDNHIGKLVTVHGYVSEASDVEPKITEAAFECQRCGTMTYIPQQEAGFQEPRECQGCERQGPFRINYDQSEFIDRQNVTLIPLPEADVEADGELKTLFEDDIAGEVTTGDRVAVVGVLQIEQEESKTSFKTHLDGVSVSKLSPQDTGLYGSAYLDVPVGEIDSEALESFVKRSVAVLRTQTLDERETRNKIITPFLHLLGWNVYHPEFRFEYSDEEVDGARVDYALLDQNGTPVLVVEAKQEGRDIDWDFSQIKKYIRLFQVQFGLLTNGERYVFFSKNPEDGSASELVVVDCKLRDLSEHQGILEAYSRESIVGSRTSLKELAEAVKEREDSEDQFDADVFQSNSGMSNQRRETLDAAKSIVSDIVEDLDAAAPLERILRQFKSELDLSQEEAEGVLDELTHKGEAYEPIPDKYRTT